MDRTSPEGTGEAEAVVSESGGLRILHILDHSLPLQSGYTFRTLAILREQRRLGWHTFHLTTPKHPSQAAEEAVEGWHFFRTPSNSDNFAGLPVVREIEQMGETTHRLEQVAKRVKPHVLHAHSPVLNAIPALRVGRRLGIPVVYEVRAFWEDAAVDHGVGRSWGLRYRVTRALETYALRRADAVTTICEGLREDIVARGINTSKVTVIPNAVDVNAFRSDKPRNAELANQLGIGVARVIGFVGSFYAYEGLAFLVDAMPELVRQMPDLKLLLVGGGPEEENLRKLVTKLSLEGRVIFTGRVPNERVQSYYKLIDVLVYPRLPTRLTTLVTPLKPLEAMAQELLLVASDVGGHRELIRDHQTGILFRAGDANDLILHLTGLFDAPGSWPALRAAGRHFVESERTWVQSVARYRGVYTSIGIDLARELPIP